ncbi:Intracellular endo-alpha-(1-_5)-L-arabinanase [Botrimarina colliarenosi]|uniref:Intracellular endo-alpha-(1->5)-L-arabinanase n=1 Tax=Botrimarina colliarenosi TaxID=2528001 RepID=A0A5C6A685_9BACT|nr:arabinan endo-1,5-alpha-L-arabinosidase [Botrimarina colliarenosi]TWT94867.1 Intracellular endo-alpha-(1->5)-L-arabinanase [Botrimarina colliarenosi]
MPRPTLPTPVSLTLAIVLLSVAGIAAAQPAATGARQGLLNGAADPTAVAVTDASGETVYYVAATGHGVKLLRSTDLAHWEPSGRVFKKAVPGWARRAVPGTDGVWAPDLSYHDGLYYLYYSVSTFGSQRSVIGLAVNKSLDPASDDYKWEDRGLVIASSAETTNFNAIDPALLVDEEGRWLLFWGSYWTGLKAVEIDPATGKPQEGAEIVAVAARSDRQSTAIEAAFPIFHDGYYYLFVSWDACCDGAESTYKVMVGRSRDALGPYVDAAGKPMLEGGGTLVLKSSERWRGPGHNGVLTTDKGQWMVHHTYDMEHLDSQRILQVRPLTWTKSGWPEVGEPVATP